jgi:hypothetical protein
VENDDRDVEERAPVSEGDAGWRRQTQETNDLADELGPPPPEGDEAEGTGPYI